MVTHVVLICISLKANDVEHLFISFSPFHKVIHISSLEKG